MKTGFFGDIQLEDGSTLGNGEYGEGSRFHDQEQVLDRIADTFIAEEVAVACCLGDVFDKPEPSPWAILAFQRFVRRLTDAGMHVIVILGNHDLKSAALPTALQIFAGEQVTVSLSPQLIPFADTVYATLPWAPMSVLVADQGRSPNLRADAIDLLAQSIQHLRLACASQYPDKTPILCGHWAVSGSTLPTGKAIEELMEPIIPWGDIDVLGWKLAAFGHIHPPQLIAQGMTSCPIFYVGSTQVCDLGEIGVPHGVWVYDDTSDELRFLAIADRPFIEIETDAVEKPGVGVMLEPSSLTPAVHGAIVRVKYRAHGLEVNEGQARADLMRMGAHKVFIKEVDRQQRASRARVGEITEDMTPTEELNLYIRSQGFEGPDHDVKQFLDALHARHARYVEELSA